MKLTVNSGGLSVKESKKIESFLKFGYKDKIMLEWGSGGSTLYFSDFVNKYYSIEHNKKWYNKINALKPDNVILKYIPNNLERSYPFVKREEFEDYINGIDEFNEKYFDIIFIDGRARIYCAEKSLDYIHDDSIIFIHDWGRKHYHSVLDFYDIIEVIDNLAILKKK